MRQALRQTQRKRVSPVQTFPPPIGGWNARDPLAAMPITDAVVLDNFFPDTNEVRLRKGSEEYIASGLGGVTVETLAEFNAGGSRKFLAGANGNVYDISTSTPSSLASGFSENRWQTTNYERHIWFFNGVDAPQKYDGTTFGATGFTGPTLSTLVQAIGFKNRLFIVKKDTDSFWYTTLNGVTGALTEFKLAGVPTRGGDLVAIDAITSDGGDGVDDLICFFMSSGDVLIYSGTDPGNDFALIGVFDLGELLSRRSVVRMGSDLVVMTRDGFKPLTRVLPFGRLSDQVNFSDKIDGAVVMAINDHSARDGWEAVLFSRGPMLIFNIPQASGFVQYVMNTSSQAWCRFTGWDATTWGMFNNDLFFGTVGGKVFQASTGNDDDGADIAADGLQAFSVFDEGGVQKRFTALRPLFTSGAELSIGMNLSIDYNITAGIPGTTTLAADVPVWDIAVWDVAAFAQETAKLAWNTVEGIGYAAAVRYRIETSGQDVSWNGTNIVYERLEAFY